MQDGKPRYNPTMLPVVTGLGLKGKSRHQIALQLGVSERTINTWERTYPEFKDAMEFAQTAAQAFYEEMVDMAIFDPAFQSNVYKLIMENRFSDTYSPKRGGGAASSTPEETSVEDRMKMIETLVGRYSKKDE